jgi:hypothetical protein
MTARGQCCYFTQPPEGRLLLLLSRHARLCNHRGPGPIMAWKPAWHLALLE